MVQRGNGSRLALEAIREAGLESLDGYGPLQARVLCQVHLAHSAGAQALADAIRSQHRTRGKVDRAVLQHRVRDVIHGLAEECAALCVLMKQGFDAAAEIRVATACVIQEGWPQRGFALKRGVENVFDLL